MAISFTIDDIDFSFLEETKIKQWIRLIVSSHGKRVGNISYLFCSDTYLIEVNRTYLNHDTYTDIITFDYVVGDVVSGDILISVDRVRENAVLFGVPFEQELHRVIIHGILHLLGQSDKTDEDAAQMRKMENESLEIWNTIQ